MRTIRVKGRHLPWISSHLISLFKQRDKYHLSKDAADSETYRYLRNLCKTRTSNAKSNYYKDSFSHDFHNPRQFWNQLNRILNKTNKSHINQIRIHNEINSDLYLVLMPLISISLLSVVCL